MFSERFRPIIEPFTSSAGRTLARAHISPNGLTAVGLMAMFGVSWLIATDRLLVAGLAFIPAVILDVLDGAIARATDRVTKLGGFLDSVADRLADGATFGAVVWLYRAGPARPLAGALLALVLSMTVPYARAKAEALGYTTPSGPGERAERAVIMIAGLILGLLEAAIWLITILAAYTLLIRCRAVWRAAR